MDTFKTTPMVDLVTQLPGLVYNPPRLFDDPDVARYTRDTGPELGAMPRAVFRELGVYVDPTTGKCEVPDGDACQHSGMFYRYRVAGYQDLRIRWPGGDSRDPDPQQPDTLFLHPEGWPAGQLDADSQALPRQAHSG